MSTVLGQAALWWLALAVIGWAAGARVNRWVAGWDHWLVCALLVWIGGRMIGSAWRQESAPQPHEAQQLRLDSSKARA